MLGLRFQTCAYHTTLPLGLGRLPTYKSGAVYRSILFVEYLKLKPR